MGMQANDASQTTLTGTAKMTTMYKVTSRTATQDPISYQATATITVNGTTLTASYGGDENECRKEVKEGAVIELRAKARKLGWNID
jgi:hypothetical protein